MKTLDQRRGTAHQAPESGVLVEGAAPAAPLLTSAVEALQERPRRRVALPKPPHRLQFGWLRVGLLLVCAGAGASNLVLPQNGWVSWRVDAVEGARDWCCFSSDQPGGRAAICDLDSRNSNYSSDSESPPVAQVQLYARMKDGEVERVRAYGPDCPVKAQGTITDLGSVSNDASARWLATQLAGRSERFSDALAALAMHGGATAEDELARMASTVGEGERRKDALFWLGHARGEAGVRRIEPLLLSDPDPQIRQQAAFAISQSSSTRRGDLVLRQARTDSDDEVRSQAWFWLAQSGDPRAEGELRTALRTEKSQKVRHQAIFALSQLPDERGVPALISVIEDRQLPIEDRKQALFWLGHSETDAAIAYLDRVLR
jgi:hypothetical protein